MSQAANDRGTGRAPTSPIAIGVVGVGKIARDQHLPALAASDAFVLTAVADRHGGVEGVPSFGTVEAMLADGPPIDAVSICTPPGGRDAIAAAAIAAGKHVMLEKPPGVTLGEIRALERAARNLGISLYASWHSREAAAVGAARDWLVGRTIQSASITWREDIRQWHPGQEWILAADGFGVFDPGINALSIATAILPGDLAVRSARLDIPGNRQAPIAADIRMALGAAPVTMTLDFMQTGQQTWEIAVVTGTGTMTLSSGGARLTIDGCVVEVPPGDGEYPALYRNFANLIRRRRSDVDLTPLELVADAFLVGDRRTVPPFDF